MVSRSAVAENNQLGAEANAVYGTNTVNGNYMYNINLKYKYRTLPLPPRLPLGVFFLLSPGAEFVFDIKPRWASVF